MKQKSTRTLLSATALAALALVLSSSGSLSAQTAGSSGTGSSSTSGSNGTGTQVPTSSSGSSTTAATPASTSSTGTSGSDGDRMRQDAASDSRNQTATSVDRGAPTPSASTGGDNINAPRASTSQSDPAVGTTSPKLNDSLSPTGANSAGMTPNGTPAAVTAANAVRTAFDADPAFAHLDVQILPQGDRLVLRGTVMDKEAKKALEKSAKAAAGNVKIDNQLMLKSGSK